MKRSPDRADDGDCDYIRARMTSEQPPQSPTAQGLDPRALAYSASLQHDRRLYRYDIACSLAHIRMLARQGIGCRVLNMASLRPLDEEAIVAAARETGAIVTAEDHSLHGGLGSLVAQVTARRCPVPVACVGLESFGTSGRWDELLQHYRLTPERLAQEARGLLAAKRGGSAFM